MKYLDLKSYRLILITFSIIAISSLFSAVFFIVTNSDVNVFIPIGQAQIGFENNEAVGCGAIKEYDNKTMEIKRMYVDPDFRGNGIASKILKELELWALELGCKKCILETGTRQIEAIALYTRNNYARMSNYGQYAGVENSLCFEKVLQ